MTQQPFTRPGAIDLSGLKRPAGPAPGRGGARPAPAADGPGGTSAYAVNVDERNLQGLLESSMTAPVVLVFFSRSRMPESGQLADDVATLSAEFEGRFLAGLVDVDASPAIASAMQIPTIPLVVMVVDGRPMPLLQDVIGLAELRTALSSVLQQLTAQGITGRHQPRGGAAAAAPGDDEPTLDPRYAPAQEALEAGDFDRAVVEFRKLTDANPADADAAAGLAMASLLQRTQAVDERAARQAAAAAPDDVDAQTLLADLALVSGDAEEAFDRLVALVRRTSGDDRDRARQHLLGLFAAVGNADPRVLKARQNLASALF